VVALVLLDLLAPLPEFMHRRLDPGELVLNSKPIAVELADTGRQECLGFDDPSAVAVHIRVHGSGPSNAGRLLCRSSW
jgi:hypothetical protein